MSERLVVHAASLAATLTNDENVRANLKRLFTEYDPHWPIISGVFAGVSALVAVVAVIFAVLRTRHVKRSADAATASADAARRSADAAEQSAKVAANWAAIDTRRKKAEVATRCLSSLHAIQTAAFDMMMEYDKFQGQYNAEPSTMSVDEWIADSRPTLDAWLERMGEAGIYFDDSTFYPMEDVKNRYILALSALREGQFDHETHKVPFMHARTEARNQLRRFLILEEDP